jgi:enamine deaminase RidA (YjgF/YER057c/UK114 family)
MTIVNPPELGKPIGYSNGVLAPSGLLCVAGQVAWDAEGRIVSDRFADQFDRALANVLAVVAAAGGAPESILRLAIFVVDVAEYVAARREVGERYRARMGRHYPAMTLVEVKALLEEGARVEIEAIAWIAPKG